MIPKGSYLTSWKNASDKTTDGSRPVSEHVFLSLFLKKTPCADFSKHVNSTISFEDSSLFTFTGKELDQETGYSYFGARYYWSEVLTGWLSVDVLVDNFPSISGYAYCNHNPIVLIDEDGDFPFIPMLIGMAGGFIKETVSQTISIGIDNLNNGKGFFSGWGSKMDWADVGVSSITGACVGLGLPVIASDAITATVCSLVDFADGGLSVAGFSKEWGDVGRNFLVNVIDLGVSYAMHMPDITTIEGFGEKMIGNGIAGYVTGLYGYGIKSGVSALSPPEETTSKINLPPVTITYPQDYTFKNGKCNINGDGERKIQNAILEAVDNY